MADVNIKQVSGGENTNPAATEGIELDNGTTSTWTQIANLHKNMTQATATQAAVVELATDAEAIAGTDTARAVTPANLRAVLATMPDGTMFNLKINVVVTSNDLVVSLLTSSGGTPSATDPGYVKINGTVRSVTAATTMTLADATSWFSSGSAVTAAQAIDYFSYAIWDSNSSVVAISAARFPTGRLVSDFSSTTTNAKYLGNYANFTATDDVVNIGRFEATLSAAAGHVWTVPTYTNLNLVQHPIFESRSMTWLATTASSTLTAQTGTPTTVTSSNTYKVKGGEVFWKTTVTVTAKGTASNSIFVQAPLVTATSAGYGQETGVTGVQIAAGIGTVADTISIRKYDGTTLWVDSYVVVAYGIGTI